VTQPDRGRRSAGEPPVAEAHERERKIVLIAARAASAGRLRGATFAGRALEHPDAQQEPKTVRRVARACAGSLGSRRTVNAEERLLQ